MASKFLVALFGTLAIAACAVRVEANLIADDPGKCLEESEYEIELSNVPPGEKRLRLCYQEGVNSVVELDCDWDAFKFNVRLTGTQHSDGSQKLTTRDVSQSLTERKIPAAGSPHKECPLYDPTTSTWNPNLVGSYSYLVNSADPAHEKNMVIRDGKLYYETTVFLHEYLWNSDCKLTSPVTTRIKLSCCAIPKPAVVTPVVIPPLSVECPLDGCKESRNGECVCEIVDDTLQLTVKYNQPLDTTFGFQLLGVTATSQTGSNPIQLIPTIPAVANAGLKLEYCHNHTGSPNHELHYASRGFTFDNQQYPFPKLECRVQLCARNPAHETATRPVCQASQPTTSPSEPKQCRETK